MILAKINSLGLNAKILLALAAIWVPYTVMDTFLNARETKELTLDQIKQWSLLTSETIRVSLNTLMREGKMSERFDMFQNLRREISVVTDINMVRSPRVNEIFEEVNQRKNIPREEEAIRYGRQEIAKLQEQLQTSVDEDEQADIRDEIQSMEEMITQAQKNISVFQQKLPTDKREVPKDELQWQVLKTGEPVFLVEGDAMRMVAPFKVQPEGCSDASGCHVYAKPGDVLGAIDMNFSIAAINKNIARNAVYMFIAKFLVGLCLLAFIAWTIHFIVIKNIMHLKKVFEKLAQGDLRESLPEDRRDEMGQLARSFNMFVTHFRAMIAKISDATQTVANSADKLADSAGHIASGAEVQATRMRNMATATDQVRHSSGEVASGIADVAVSAQDADKRAHHGNETVANAITGMKSIAKATEESSEILGSLAAKADDINKIMEFVNSIARQTNLLALNAAIEAARAGEHGRGFTVVSAEVRNLAMKTSQASQEVATIVTNIHEDTQKALQKMEEKTVIVTQGLGLTEQANMALQEIVTCVGKVTELTANISAEARQQCDAADDIAKDVRTTDEVTNEVAVGARGVAEESKHLRGLIPTLQEAVSSFKL